MKITSSPCTHAIDLPPKKRRCLDENPRGVSDDDTSTETKESTGKIPVVSAPALETRAIHGDGTSSSKILPVTLLSGFLGAGKTTLLKQILESKNNVLKIAVIVNDMGELNIDANEIKKHKLIQEKQEMVEMHNGCICCTLRGDLLKTVKKLAMEEKYDYLVIESTGISEPLPVAQTFTMDVNGEEEDHDHQHDKDEENEDDKDKDNEDSPDFEPLSNYARMDTLVTVLDAYNFGSILGNVESEADREKFFGGADEATMEDIEESEESIVKLLIDQIEFANVILLNKIDLLSDGNDGGGSSIESQVKAIRALIQKLNPKATVVVPEKPKFDGFNVDKIVNTGLFDIEEAQESAGWIAELEKPHHTPETEEYGIGSFVFRNNERPFHPERLAKIMKNFGTGLVKEIAGASTVNESKTENDDNIDLFSRVVRCKGQVWLSNADACPIDVHSVGRQLEMAPAGNGVPWVAKVVEMCPNGDPASDKVNEDHASVWQTFDLTDEGLNELKASDEWAGRFGDRRSEIVFIGIKMDKKRLLIELGKALLTDAEFNVDEKDRKFFWASNMSDEFFDGMPLWDLADILEEEEDDDGACELMEDENN